MINGRTKPTRQPDGGKLLYLESIRGIAAMTVVLFHGNFITGLPLTGNYFVLQSYLMVDLFFVLSGFVISYNYWTKINSATNLLIFQFRRFLRLYPLHLITLFVFLGIEILKYIFERMTGITAGNPAFSTNNLTAFINNLFLTQSFLGKVLTFNFPSWSISTEFYTYLLFAIFILIVKNETLRRFILGAVIVVSGCVLIVSHCGDTTTGLAIVRCIYAFFIGSLLWAFSKNVKIRLPEYVPNIIVPLVFASILFNDIIVDQVYPLLFALVIFSLFASGESAVKKLLSVNQLIFLGTVSYGVYMWSASVWWAIKNGLQYGLKVPIVIVGEDDHLKLDPAVGLAVVATGVVVILVLSWLSYRFLEAPINNYRHNLPFRNE